MGGGEAGEGWGDGGKVVVAILLSLFFDEHRSWLYVEGPAIPPGHSTTASPRRHVAESHDSRVYKAPTLHLSTPLPPQRNAASFLDS